MLSLYRRHEPACRFRKQGVRHITCSCPVWMDGYELGVRKRRSMGTRSWQHAQDIPIVRLMPLSVFRTIPLEVGESSPNVLCASAIAFSRR